MNQERLIKIIEDMQECISDLEECTVILQNNSDNKIIVKLAKSSLRGLFLSFNIMLEDFCSIMLKEIKKYKIGITLHDSLVELKEHNILDEDMFVFLDKSIVIRNRIFHRYKELTHEELLEHILKYKNNFKEIVVIAKKYLI